MKLKKIINFIIIVSLFAYGVFFSILYLRKLDPSMSIIIEEHDSSSISGDELFAGKKINQEIKTSYDNLGIISVRFRTYNRINNDTLIFRLKRKDDSNWIYEAKYNTDQFQDRDYFPFGFPPINTSKNQVYVFEMESTKGSDLEYVSIDERKPAVLTKYHYPIRQYSYKSIIFYKYILMKILNLLTNISLLFPIISYFIPLVFFLLYIQIIKHKKLFPSILIILPIIMFIIQSVRTLNPPQYWETTLFIFWFLYILINKLDYKINFVLVLFIFPFMVHQIVIANYESAEIYASCVLIFLIIGYIHSLLISIFNIENLINTKKYFLSLIKPIK